MPSQTSIRTIGLLFWIVLMSTCYRSYTISDRNDSAADNADSAAAGSSGSVMDSGSDENEAAVGPDGAGSDDDDTGSIDEPDDCVPDCDNRECGSDGCDGTCPPGCSQNESCDEQTGLCICVPDCEVKECGSDGCGGTCPPGCSQNESCDEQTGLCVCVPDCDAKECGRDGCGGTCPPGCPKNHSCDEQTGLCECFPDCEHRQCGSDGCDGFCEPGCADYIGCSPDGECIAFTEGPSCDGLDYECWDGDDWVSCCDAKLIVGGTFLMGQGEIGSSDYFWYGSRLDDERPEHQTTVADFYLDTFEVTVDRFRQYVSAYDAGWRPDIGDGTHPYIPESGWQQSWDSYLPNEGEAWIRSIGCNEVFGTWSDIETENQRLPINCVNWYEAFAFCIWDGGRLPTEAEWEYAAAGGAENRLYPWGGDTPDATRSVFYCTAFDDRRCSFADILEVGDKTSGSNIWGIHDLSGSMWEWTLDSYDEDWYSRYQDECDNCANLEEGARKVPRGGSFLSNSEYLRAAYRSSGNPEMPYYDIGIRCARTPGDQ